MKQARKKLGNYIIIAFFLNVFAILSVGGVCILMVKDIVQNITALEEESENVSIADDISNRIHGMTYAVHQTILNIDSLYINYAITIIEDVENEVLLYKRKEEKRTQRHSPEEVLILGRMLNDIAGLKKELHTIYQRFSDTGVLDRPTLAQLERYGSAVQNQASQLNRIHFTIIEQLVRESHDKMYFILFLYLISALVGIFASVVGYIIMTRNTVFPIKDLAFATQKVADGDLSVRVATSSATEIGTLYDSFNIMTERLEEHQRRREEFNRELELQVRERTAELREANVSLRKAQSDLIRMEKIATLGQMATTVNHEIKTPLNSLYLNLQLLTKKINKIEIEDPKPKENMLAVTGIIDSEIVRINEILEEFVKYARFSSPTLKPNDLNAIISNIAGMIGQNAEKSHVQVKLSLADDVGVCMVDDKKITQALLNLCVNAIHAMPDGGSLFIESAKTSEHVIITIADTGTGIDKEDLEKIFEPFFTKKEKGLGFGLSIVQRIIEDHKGWISCFSEKGEYTIFEIILPLAEKTENQTIPELPAGSREP